MTPPPDQSGQWDQWDHDELDQRQSLHIAVAVVAPVNPSGPAAGAGASGGRARMAASSSPAIPAKTGRARLPMWLRRDLLLLLGGQAVSLLGTGATLTALPLLVLALTGSAFSAGLVELLRLAPVALLSLPAGAIVDRVDRKALMIWCDAGRALLLGSLPAAALLLGSLTLPHIYAVAALEGALACLFDLAAFAALPRVAAAGNAGSGGDRADEGDEAREAAQIERASAAYAVVYNSAQLTGPLVGGALYAVRQVLPLAVDAVSYLASIGALALIHTPFQNVRRPRGVARARTEAGAERQTSLFRETWQGLRWLRQNPTLRALALLCAAANLVLAPFALLLITLAQGQGAGAPAVGAVLAASGVGAVCGPLLAVRLGRRGSFAWIFVGGLLVEGLCWGLVAAAPTIALLAAAAAAAMVADQVFNVAQLTLRARVIPDALQGRVLAVYRLGLMASQPLGFALVGAAIDGVGPALVAALGGAYLIVLGLLALATPAVRRVGHGA